MPFYGHVIYKSSNYIRITTHSVYSLITWFLTIPNQVLFMLPLSLILPKKENTFMRDLSGKHSNLAILEGNKDVIQSKQSPLTEISENSWERRERKGITIL